MNLLFLDLSSKSSGYCVRDDKKNILTYGCIASSSQNVLKRLKVMRDGIINLIRQYDIKKIVAEEIPGLYNNNRTYKVLTYLQGIMMLAAFEENEKIEITFLQSSTWRSQIGIQTGRGHKRDELKAKDIEYVNNKYKIIANDDVCDAICLSDAYFRQTFQYDWTE